MHHTIIFINLQLIFKYLEFIFVLLILLFSKNNESVTDQFSGVRFDSSLIRKFGLGRIQRTDSELKRTEPKLTEPKRNEAN